MKLNIKIHGIALLWVCSIGCNNVPEKQSEGKVVKASFLPLCGYWIKNDYLEELERTKSSRASYPKALGISALSIAKPDNGDSCRVGIYYNFHEGNESVLHSDLNSYHLKEKGNGLDGTLKLINDSLLALDMDGDVKIYRRIETNVDFDIKGYLAKRIFPMNYFIVDSLKTIDEDQVSIIKKDGSVTTSTKLKKISLEIDYAVYDEDDTSSYLTLTFPDGKSKNFNYIVNDQIAYVLDKKFKRLDEEYILDKIDTVYRFIPKE